MVPTSLFHTKPFGQSRQAVAAAEAYRPRVHSVHAGAPAVETKPSAHVAQVLSDTSEFEKRPAGHVPHGGVSEALQIAPPHVHAAEVAPSEVCVE